jgi:hypothetical protein
MNCSLKTVQRGDSDLWTLCILVTLMFLLFSGEPTVWDAIRHWAKATVPVAEAPKAPTPEPKKGLSF